MEGFHVVEYKKWLRSPEGQKYIQDKREKHVRETTEKFIMENKELFDKLAKE